MGNSLETFDLTSQSFNFTSQMPRDEALGQFLIALGEYLTSNNSGSGTPPVETSTISGELGWWGDPHLFANMTVDGEQVKMNVTTEGGAGENINMLDTDNIDIETDFVSWRGRDDVTVVGSTKMEVYGDTIEVDAKTNEVTVNGKSLSDMEDGICTVNGNTITKKGDKVTIETADGQKIEIVDRGDYLDGTVTLKDYKTSLQGDDGAESMGMIGDPARGVTNDKAMDYVIEGDDSGCGCPEQDAKWAAQLIALIAQRFGGDSELGQILMAFANFLGSSSGGSALQTNVA